MSPFLTAKLALMLVAAILLGWGMHTENSALRWAGIGFLFIALILRFFKPNQRRDS
jgi:hypothetical protein